MLQCFYTNKITKRPLCRRISGIMSVPLYLNDFLPGSHLVISNITGLPVYQRKADVTFTVSCTYTYIHAQFFKRVGYIMHEKFPPPAQVYHLQNYGFCRMNVLPNCAPCAPLLDVGIKKHTLSFCLYTGANSP